MCSTLPSESPDYMREKRIPHAIVGKLVVATTQTEVPALQRIFANAVTNQVPGVRYIDECEGIREIEPEARGIAAIYSPETGITDWAQVARSLQSDITQAGGMVLTGHKVVSIGDCGDRVMVTADTSTSLERAVQKSTVVFETRQVVTCAGTYADRIAVLSGGTHAPQIVPIRGEYLVIPADNPLAQRIRGNIYPVPVHGVPFLGVHFTRTLAGDVILGPNAVLALSRDGYSNSSLSDIHAGDMLRLCSYVGFWRLMARHGRYGVGEAWRSAWPPSAVRRAARYVPGLLLAADVRRGGRSLAGVRAQAVGRDGELIDDFVFERTMGGKVVHTRNAPSPGATSALAIAEVIADYVEET
jgi:L-2-hydroxyglutarate oxidase LhgO